MAQASKLEGAPPGMEAFANQLTYTPPPANQPVAYETNMPGAKLFTQAALSAFERGNNFGATTQNGFESFRQITRACGTAYNHNDTTGAETIARSTAASEAQRAVVDQNNQGGYYNKLRAAHPEGHWPIGGSEDITTTVPLPDEK